MKPVNHNGTLNFYARKKEIQKINNENFVKFYLLYFVDDIELALKSLTHLHQTTMEITFTKSNFSL